MHVNRLMDNERNMWLINCVAFVRITFMKSNLHKFTWNHSTNLSYGQRVALSTNKQPFTRGSAAAAAAAALCSDAAMINAVSFTVK